MDELWEMIPAELRSRISRTDSCWLWIGHKDDKGYGIFHPGQENPKRVPRMIYECVHGVLRDKSQLVCHDCPGGDNPSCCNPAHLFLGTHQDNRADCVQKGRQAKGEGNGRAVLSGQQVEEIRRLYVPRKMSVHKLGRMFGVSGQQIYRILKGQSWSHAK